MNLPRRRFLHLAAGAAATATLAQSTVPSPARAQATGSAVIPKRPSRDRLENALARIADPKGEGAAPVSPYIPILHVRLPMLPMRGRAPASLSDRSMVPS